MGLLLRLVCNPVTDMSPLRLSKITGIFCFSWPIDVTRSAALGTFQETGTVAVAAMTGRRALPAA